MRRSTATLATPGSFSFMRTVLSHGWFDLPPYQWDGTARILRRVFSTAPGRHHLAEIREPRRDLLEVRLLTCSEEGSRRSGGEKASLVRQIRHSLRLDESLAEFHRLCSRTAGYVWIPRQGAGLLLRAPEPFEDLVKLLCTTNCTWALTRVMVNGLVEGLGEPVEFARESGTRRHFRSFPTPAAMASAPARFYAREAKAGYRAPYLEELSKSVASGRLDPARWLDPERPTAEIRKEIESVKGAGRYVSENMLKLVGRYEGLGIDSWCRREFARIHRRGRRASDASIQRFYARFGRWRGLALWCDLTRDWFDGSEPAGELLRAGKY
jgi:N-glycosylase/DNA lyase